jgi:hypothetical protein
VAWRGVAWRGVAWRGVAWRGVAWRGVAWRGVSRTAVHCDEHLLCRSCYLLLQHDGQMTWSETGDRYLLKLFRDYVFHQVRDLVMRLAWLPPSRD